MRSSSPVVMSPYQRHVAYHHRAAWHNQSFIEQRCEGFEALARNVEKLSPESAESVTGICAELVRRIAKAYSQTKSAMIFYGMGITQFVSGTQNVIALADLALVCGQIGRPGTGINPLRGQNNVQGACDMAVCQMYIPVIRLRMRPMFSINSLRAWGGEVAEGPGLTSLGMTKLLCQVIFVD